jgi:DNA-binding FadR family transcriptional regulator
MFRSMVSPHSPVPLHQQVANDIREKINNGTWPPDTELKAEKDLAHDYGVGKDTLRDAFVVLKAEGLIETKRGYRARVRVPMPKERVWLRSGEIVAARMPVQSERQEHDIGEGIPVFLVGDKLYPADRYEFFAK